MDLGRKDQSGRKDGSSEGAGSDGQISGVHGSHLVRGQSWRGAGTSVLKRGGKFCKGGTWRVKRGGVTSEWTAAPAEQFLRQDDIGVKMSTESIFGVQIKSDPSSERKKFIQIKCENSAVGGELKSTFDQEKNPRAST